MTTICKDCGTTGKGVHHCEAKEKASDVQIGGDHYKNMSIQPSTFITRNSLGWCEGNAIKYICRHHLKAGEADIDKAIHYLQLLKEIEYGK